MFNALSPSEGIASRETSPSKVGTSPNRSDSRVGVVRVLILSLFLCVLSSANGQIGGLDPSFQISQILNAGESANVRAIAVGPSGSVIVVGDFTSVSGVEHNRIARFTTTGALDPTFQSGSGANGVINAVALQPDGKILIGGDFTAYAGANRNRIARLNSDGTLDLTFDPGTGADAPVHAIAFRETYYYGPEATIYIGGEFTSFNGTSTNRLARLNSDGSLDPNFNTGNGANDTVYAIVVNNDYSRSIYIGGAFTNFDGQSRQRVARLDSSGYLDWSFHPNLDGPVYALALIGDQFSWSASLYVGGDFTNVDGLARVRVAKFTVDNYGSGNGLDPFFNVWADAPVRCIIPGNGSSPYRSRILLGGDFTVVNGISKQGVARILVGNDNYYGPYGPQGSADLDVAFNPPPGVNGSIFAMAAMADGRTWVAGAFTEVSGIPSGKLARLYGDYGSTLPGIPSSPRAEAASDHQIILEWRGASSSSSHKIEISSDGGNDWTPLATAGSSYVASGLTAGISYSFRVRGSNYNGDGEFSETFQATTDATPWVGPGVIDPSTGVNSGPNSTVNAIVRQPDGKILIAGSFSQVDGAARKYIARLNADWTLDPSFDPATGPNSSIKAVALQPDGKILIVGDFSTVAGVSRKYIARLTSSGGLDSSFDPGVGPNSSVETVAVQGDGKVLVGGWFSTFGGYSQDYIARLNADGTLDMAYRTTANSIVYSIELQTDGKAIIGGSFSTVNGVSKRGIARIQSDGSLDTNFNQGDGVSSVKDLFIQPDGKVMVVGGFSTFDGIPRKYVARVDNLGDLDTSFDPGTGPNSSVECVSVDEQGKVLIGGYFTSVSGTFRFRVARLNSNGSLDITFRPGVGMNNVVNDLIVLPDTKVVAGGSFSTVGGEAKKYLARLNGGLNGQLLILTVSPMPTGTAGEYYTQAFEVSGGTSPYSWSITTGALPPGLSLSNTGTLDGTPTKTIRSNFVLRVTDATSQYVEREFSLDTFDIPSGLVILEANYGAGSTFVDVESYITFQIVNDAVNMPVSNGSLGGDPVSGKVKTLYVRYQDSTGHYETSVQEGGTLILPNSSSVKLPIAYPQWASTKFSSGQLGQASISGVTEDPDGDNVSNLLESAFAGNPNVPDGADILPTIEVIDDHLRITFICDSTRTDLIYSVEVSEDLIDWTTEIARSSGGGPTLLIDDLATVSDGGGGLRYVSVTESQVLTTFERRFIRVKVSIQ